MARLLTTGYESGDPAGTDVTSGTGTVDAESTTVNSGIASKKYTAPASTDRAYTLHDIGTPNAEVFFRVYFRYSGTLPSGGVRDWFWSIASSGSALINIALYENFGSPVLRLRRGNTLYADPAPVTADTWYCVEAHLVGSVGGDEFTEWRVDGVGYGDETAAMSSSLFQTVRIGAAGDDGAQTFTGVEFFIDDIAINDTTGGSDNSWVGPISSGTDEIARLIDGTLIGGMLVGKGLVN